jgi:type IV pilus assembly protein PilA
MGLKTYKGERIMFKNLKKKLKDQRGLTLIELLAVIVILGIIAAIAVPSIGKLISNTEDDAKVAEGIQIINAAKLYVAAEAPDTTVTLTHAAASGNVAASGELLEYLDNLQDESFSVTINKSTTGKYTYSLADHESITVLNKKLNPDQTAVSEKDLLDN